jgi:hypothetical protein
MILDILRDAILSNIGSLKQAPNRWNKRHCMLCHTQGHGKDTRNRFGIQFNPNSIALNCFNCKFSAGYTEGKDLSKSFEFFLNQINLDKKFIDEIKFEIYRQRNNIVTLREGEDRDEDPEARFRNLFSKWKPIDLPADSLPISQWLECGLDDPNFLRVAEYAISRNIVDFDNFYWSPQKSHNLQHRLIIPYFYKRKIVGFTARLCYNTDGKEIPKYYQQVPSDFVYNLDNQDGWSRKYCIVTEGVLDAWTVDGIGTLGDVSQGQIDIINRLQKEIIVCPDEDNSGATLVEVAIRNKWSVAFPKWDREIKDASKAAEKYGRLLTTHSIISTAVSSETKIRAHWKIWLNDRNRIRKYD